MIYPTQIAKRALLRLSLNAFSVPRLRQTLSPTPESGFLDALLS